MSATESDAFGRCHWCGNMTDSAGCLSVSCSSRAAPPTPPQGEREFARLAVVCRCGAPWPCDEGKGCRWSPPTPPQGREAVARLREELRLADDADEDLAVAGLTAWRDAVRDVLVVARAHAREVGYALAVHGSLHRDLDVVAAPWSENAVDADALVSTVSDAMVRAELAYGIVEGRVEEKPHGRRAYAIHLRGDGPSYMDLSVAPRATPPAPADEAEEAGPWLVRAADRMAHEVVCLTDSGTLGTRTPLAVDRLIAAVRAQERARREVSEAMVADACACYAMLSWLHYSPGDTNLPRAWRHHIAEATEAARRLQEALGRIAGVDVPITIPVTAALAAQEGK